MSCSTEGEGKRERERERDAFARVNVIQRNVPANEVKNCAILSAIVAYHVWISKNILEFIIVCFRIVFGTTNDF